MRPYGEPEYRAARDVMAHDDMACVHRIPGVCAGRATSPDHVPALAEHRHVRGSGCCVLVPSCRPCNEWRGRQIGNRRRRRSSPTRLTPGSGSLT